VCTFDLNEYKKTNPFLIVSSAIVISFLASAAGLLLSSSFAQENETTTTATNETGEMMTNQTNQTQAGGNQTQQGPLEQLGEAVTGIFGGGGANQSR
jgi:hypothetical protein